MSPLVTDKHTLIRLQSVRKGQREGQEKRGRERDEKRKKRLSLLTCLF